MPLMTPELIAAAKARADAPLVEFFKLEVPRLLAEQESDVSQLRSRFPGLASRFLSPLVFQGSADDFADGGFIPRLGKLKDRNECDFIFNMIDISERVRWGLAYFALQKPDARLPEAKRLTMQQLRTKWQLLGVPVSFNQTVADHHHCVTALAKLLFPDQPDVERCVQVQNNVKAVIGDFTPYDPLSDEDKAGLEALAVRLLMTSSECRSNPQLEEFREAAKISSSSIIWDLGLRNKINDCNLLGTSLEALHIMDCCPSDKKRLIVDGLREIRTRVETGLTCERSRKLFKGLAKAWDGMEVAAQEIWQGAVAAVSEGEQAKRLYSEMIAGRVKEWDDNLAPHRPPVLSPQAQGADFQPRPAT